VATSYDNGDDDDGGDDAHVRLTLVLSRPERPWAGALRSPDQMADAMFGLHVFLDASDRHRVERAPLDGRTDQPDAPWLIHETCYTPSCELRCTLKLRLDLAHRLLLVPATFGPAQFGPFHIAVHSDRALAMEECVVCE